MKYVSIALATCIAIGTPARGTIKKSNKDCCSGSSYDQVLEDRNTNYRFGIAVLNRVFYTLGRIEFRVEKADKSKKVNLAVITEDVLTSRVAMVEFHDYDVSAALGITRAELRSEGFRIEVKIKSVGSGAGRQDKCQNVEMDFVEEEGWHFKKKNANLFKPVGDRRFTVFYATGQNSTVNNVRCELHGILPADA